MALNDILTSMDGARDALVTAINAKGGSLADNATLYQCADAVGSLSGGTSAEYYKCASVDTEAKTWSGYKAVFDSTAGTWSFESDVTAGLAYNFMTPSVGGVYDADCTMTASLDTGEISLLSPHNMTSYDNGTWSVIASYEEKSSTPAWKVFDGTVGSTDTGYWSAYGKTDAYITCTRTTPFVPKLIKMHEANYFWCIGGTLVVSGSNGNDEWIELFNGANPMTAQSPDYYSLALDNNADYRSIKLHFSGVQNRVFLSELEIWGR